MVMASEKLKLIISATRELRAARCNGLDMAINVGVHRVEATERERLLGVILNQDLKWSNHLWGEKWR